MNPAWSAKPLSPATTNTAARVLKNRKVRMFTHSTLRRVTCSLNESMNCIFPLGDIFDTPSRNEIILRELSRSDLNKFDSSTLSFSLSLSLSLSGGIALGIGIRKGLEISQRRRPSSERRPPKPGVFDHGRPVERPRRPRWSTGEGTFVSLELLANYCDVLLYFPCYRQKRTSCTMWASST